MKTETEMETETERERETETDRRTAGQTDKASMQIYEYAYRHTDASSHRPADPQTKTKALSIKHLVLGCLEGVFAQGQVYVLVSRVTDPHNFVLVGLPPKDLLDAVAAGWRQAGFNVDECFRRAVSVTNEWTYAPGNDNTSVVDRIAPKWISERAIPHKLRSLEESLNPQPMAAAVIHKLLDWIDRVDSASKFGLLPPAFKTPEGEDIFPDEPWWLTDVQRKEEPEGEKEPIKGDEDGPASEDEAADLEDAPPDDALTEDEDPLSDADAADTMDSQEQRSKMDRDPRLGWHGGAAGVQPVSASSRAPVLPLMRKRKRGSLEDEAAPGAAQSSSPQEVSPFMRACGNNPDQSLPRDGQ